MSNIVVSIPSRGQVPAVAFPFLCGALLRGQTYWSATTGGGLHLHTSARAYVEWARNDAYKNVVDVDASHVLFVDDDAAPPADVLQRLHACGVDVVSAFAVRRAPPYQPSAYRDGVPLDRPATGLHEIDRVGFHTILISRRALDAVAELNGGKPFRTDPVTGWGEDHAFCADAESLGYRVHVLADCESGHVEERIVGRAERGRAAADALAQARADERETAEIWGGLETPLSLTGR